MESSSYYKNENKLLFDNNVVVSANSDIQDFLLINHCIIILVDPLRQKSDRNIYCYSLNGKLKWQIAQPDEIHAKNYYTAIYLGDVEGQFNAYNISGVEVIINIDDGAVIKKELIK